MCKYAHLTSLKNYYEKFASLLKGFRGCTLEFDFENMTFELTINEIIKVEFGIFSQNGKICLNNVSTRDSFLCVHN